MTNICKFCQREIWAGIQYTAPSGIPAFACWDCYPMAQQEIARRREEEIEALRVAGKCRFLRAWIGWCGNDGHPYCPKHQTVKCSVCGRQAITECSDAGSLVCGRPLCDKCKCPAHYSEILTKDKP